MQLNRRLKATVFAVVALAVAGLTPGCVGPGDVRIPVPLIPVYLLYQGLNNDEVGTVGPELGNDSEGEPSKPSANDYDSWCAIIHGDVLIVTLTPTLSMNRGSATVWSLVGESTWLANAVVPSPRGEGEETFARFVNTKGLWLQSPLT